MQEALIRRSPGKTGSIGKIAQNSTAPRTALWGSSLFILHQKSIATAGKEVRMSIFTVGRMAVKIAGRDAGRTCVVVEVQGNLVVIDGNVRRRTVNVKHLEPLAQMIDLKAKASHEDVKKAFEAMGLPVWEKKSKKPSARPRKQKNRKQNREEPKPAKKPVKTKKVEPSDVKPVEVPAQ